MTLMVTQSGITQPQPIPIHAFSEARRFEGFSIHLGAAVTARSTLIVERIYAHAYKVGVVELKVRFAESLAGWCVGQQKIPLHALPIFVGKHRQQLVLQRAANDPCFGPLAIKWINNSTVLHRGPSHCIYAAPVICDCLYIGSQEAFDQYRSNQQLDVAGEQKMAAQMYYDAAWNWDAWGPWGPLGPIYGPGLG
jgi:hypothetical protein